MVEDYASWICADFYNIGFLQNQVRKCFFHTVEKYGFNMV